MGPTLLRAELRRAGKVDDKVSSPLFSAECGVRSVEWGTEEREHRQPAWE
jgi:hypothetical protein